MHTSHVRITKSPMRWRKKARQLKRLSRHRFALPVLTFVLLMVFGAFGYHALANSEPSKLDAKVVIISHDGVSQTVPSIEPTVGALLNKLNIPLREGDVVEPARDTPINQDDFRINIYRAVPVEIVDGVHHSYTFSAATTPRSIAQQANVEVGSEDYVSTVPVHNFLQEDAVGERVVIDRATPVHLNLYGSQIVLSTHAKTVGELLKEKKITLQRGDVVQPGATTPLTANQQVFVIRKGVKLLTVKVPIPMPVQRVLDSSLAYGTTAIRQAGSPGEKVVTYQVRLQNGKEVGRTSIQTVVSVQPVTQIVVEGTNLGGIKGDMALAGIAPSDYNYADYIISHESQWDPSASNPYSGAYGLCQALPGSKMASVGSDWATNPITQLKWCNGYAVDRYGSWYGAYSYWIANGNW